MPVATRLRRGVSFNGAAAEMPRSGLWRPSGTRRFTSGFNGAAAEMPRSDSAGQRTVAAETCFNGAAAEMPRSAIHLGGLTVTATRFNGAAAEMPRSEMRRAYWR